jgi:hypothetical protein
MTPCSFARRESLVLALAACAAWVLGAGGARADTIGAASSAFDLDVAVTVTPTLLPAYSINTGPLNFVSAAGPAGAAFSPIPGPTLVFPPFVVSTSLMNSTATTSFVPLGAGRAYGRASLGDLSIGIPLLFNLSTSLMEATADVSDNGLGAITYAGKTSLGGSLSVLGIGLGQLPLYPAANTTLFSSGGVTVVLNKYAVTLPPTPSETHEAIEITLTNAPYLDLLGGGVINGTIDICEAQAALLLAPPVVPAAPAVPEPASVLLLSFGLTGLALAPALRKKSPQRH